MLYIILLEGHTVYYIILDCVGGNMDILIADKPDIYDMICFPFVLT